ncbi:ovochymase-2-like isoform X2 [Topomyia yanbarensis]|uniref:ovochymase-2-like isoform X2 n=1 Tax=Topomyia yanbarensis TaxID=2498891 RepID=UPI00273BBFE1|nr:ovochymase-2-like isoform X2 [Topomyia yanbarensis]
MTFAMRVLLSLILLLAASKSRAIQVKTDQSDRYRCGQRPINTVAVITAGQTTQPGEFPWHAAIYRMEQLGSSYICGGFLISDRMTITAAHCVTNPNGFKVVPSGISVRLGMFELITVSKSTQEHRVEKIYRHENYTASSYRHDIAVLLLHTIAEFNEYIQPICLWDTNEYGDGGELVGVVAGWGLTEYEMLASTLKSTEMPMVSFLECLDGDRNLFSQVLFDGMFCAGLRNGTNVCNGDSGGAFAVKVNGSWVARGIISFTGLRENTVSLCNPRSFAGFVNIPRYVEWIEKVANLDRFIIIDNPAVNSPREHTGVSSSTVAPSESPSRMKCAEYKNGSQELSYLAYVARDTPFMRVIDCFVIVISKRFLISTAGCRSLHVSDKSSEDEQFVVIETEGQAFHYEIEDFHQHPEFSRSPTDENNLALIELKRNTSLSTGQFVCLWSDKDFDVGKIFLYSATGMVKGFGASKPAAKCFNQLIAPSIMIRSPADGVYHLVGVIVSSTCTKIRFIKLQQFIPWIESIVWK